MDENALAIADCDTDSALHSPLSYALHLYAMPSGYLHCCLRQTIPITSWPF